jgi:DNA-binding NarL/FixJ family response regulator
MKPVDGVRIVLVDHHGMECDCLKNLIETRTDMCVVGQVDSGVMALRRARELNPHLIIMDVTMEGSDGIYAMRKISEELADVKIVGLFGSLSAYVICEMLKAGTTGLVSKEHPFSELLQALKHVLAGHIYLCPKTKDILATEHIQHCLNDVRAAEQDHHLLGRERSVLRLAAEGKSVKEIALVLELTPKTVDACRRRLMRRLGLSSMAALVKYAIRTGLTSL